jgi:hypothetical protein
VIESVKVHGFDQLGQYMTRLARDLPDSRPMMARVGKAAEIELRRHFKARNEEPNARGWPKKDFWLRTVADNTALTSITDSTAVISIASVEFLHKLNGGTIYPKRGRALAIPLNAEAYEKGSPAAWDNQDELFIIRRRGAVGRGSGLYLARRDGQALRLMFALLPHVTHRADPAALPDMAELEERLIESASAYYRQIIGGDPR